MAGLKTCSGEVEEVKEVRYRYRAEFVYPTYTRQALVCSLDMCRCNIKVFMRADKGVVHNDRVIRFNQTSNLNSIINHYDLSPFLLSLLADGIGGATLPNWLFSVDASIFLTFFSGIGISWWFLYCFLWNSFTLDGIIDKYEIFMKVWSLLPAFQNSFNNFPLNFHSSF